MLQRNPNRFISVGRFAYDIPTPISAGTTVNAYNKKYRLVQKGSVMAYDYDNAMYLVHFESEQFGNELCPDTDVATYGKPKILIQAPKDTIEENPLQDEICCALSGCSFGESGKIVGVTLLF